MSDRRYGPGGMTDIWREAERRTEAERLARLGEDSAKKPEWTEKEVVGGTDSELEVRSGLTPKSLLVSADSKNQPNSPPPIAPGEVRRMVFTSTVPWAASAFSVSSEHAHLFVLESMQCARMEFVPDEGIPCTLLSDAACVECRLPRVKRHLPTSWPTCLPGTCLTMMVKNVGAEPSHFRGTFEAVAANPHPYL